MRPTLLKLAKCAAHNPEGSKALPPDDLQTMFLKEAQSRALMESRLKLRLALTLAVAEYAIISKDGIVAE